MIEANSTYRGWFVGGDQSGRVGQPGVRRHTRQGPGSARRLLRRHPQRRAQDGRQSLGRVPVERGLPGPRPRRVGRSIRAGLGGPEDGLHPADHRGGRGRGVRGGRVQDPGAGGHDARPSRHHGVRRSHSRQGRGRRRADPLQVLTPGREGLAVRDPERLRGPPRAERRLHRRASTARSNGASLVGTSELVDRRPRPRGRRGHSPRGPDREPMARGVPARLRRSSAPDDTAGKGWPTDHETTTCRKCDARGRAVRLCRTAACAGPRCRAGQAARLRPHGHRERAGRCAVDGQVPGVREPVRRRGPRRDHLDPPARQDRRGAHPPDRPGVWNRSATTWRCTSGASRPPSTCCP